MPISPKTKIHHSVVIHNEDLINLYDCTINKYTQIGPFVEIQKNVTLGARCKISSHTFICEGVTIGNDVFIGHGVMFTNDKYPQSTNTNGKMQSRKDWNLIKTKVLDGASIGSNATILPGVTIGKGALIGAGATITKDVPNNKIVIQNNIITGDVKKTGTHND
tara:strand:- start:1966 stop:2454 length:489 start_codon:yes stop_codon:yes gene_type:complete